MRNTDYKLLRFDSGTEEFYHITNDPDENTNLLTGTLDAGQLSNYQYLCNEMTMLVGTGNFCPTSSATENPHDDNRVWVSPNPFADHIVLKNYVESTVCKLSDSTGKLIFSGKNIGLTDFSALPPGIYFLNLLFENPVCVKLVKS